MFKGFSEQSVDFVWNLRFNNSFRYIKKELYPAHAAL